MASPTPTQLIRLKAYLHVDHDEDDEMLREFYSAAVEYLEKGGVSHQASALYTQAVHGLVRSWYDGAEPSSAHAVGLRQIINQLKLSEGR